MLIGPSIEDLQSFEIDVTIEFAFAFEATSLLRSEIANDEPGITSAGTLPPSPLSTPLFQYWMSLTHPRDIDVVELHDCFSANELLTYDALGLCEHGQAGAFIDSDPKFQAVNPSGGLISKGHPLGATGLAQCAEMCWQLRGEAAKRQIPNATIALSHNLGLGGAVVVTVYRRPQAWRTKPMKRKVDVASASNDSE